MQIFLLIQDPDTARQRIRVVATSLLKAKNHDPDLRGLWETGPRLGWFVVNSGSLTGKHHIVRPALANKELEIYANTDAPDV